MKNLPKAPEDSHKEFPKVAEIAPVEILAPGDMRLDQLIASALSDVSRAEAQRWITQGAVQVSGQPARASDRPNQGEVVRVSPQRPRPSAIQPEPIPLDIVYEDESLLVVDKRAGLTVHPGAGAHSGTLVNALIAHCGALSVIGGEERPGIVHRLDRETSGLLVVAKNDAAHRSLAAQIAAKAAGREYRAIAWGIPSWNHARVVAPVGRDPRHRTRMAVVPVEDGGRAAETLLDAEERLPMGVVLRARLTTGRTHQIRVHCHYSGLPLVGDPVYGDHRARCRAVKDPVVRERLEALKRQALHACFLSFVHPLTGDLLEFRSEPPEDWQEILNLMRRARLE
ncbi:MAG TPA: RluA family pseudouridine synthase [Armatimonadota bacterium]|nr:RluA family pseudouridine synthase [Armatimonadota bacterium]